MVVRHEEEGRGNNDRKVQYKVYVTPKEQVQIAKYMNVEVSSPTRAAKHYPEVSKKCFKGKCEKVSTGIPKQGAITLESHE